MKVKLLIGIIVIAAVATAVFVIRGAHGLAGNNLSIDDVVDFVIESRLDRIASEGGELGEVGEINVLLIGLDTRKGSDEAHCDAIHMFSINTKAESLVITSVPRGTVVYIPGGPYDQTDYYVSNACAFAGLDYGISQIEKITQKHADFVVTVGFSQVVGVLRLMELPTTETLQWLRHRHSYGIGEPQRIHNQAVFMKDMIISQLDRFRSDLTLPVQYLLYKTVNTDMDFSTARALLEYLIAIKIDERPDDIVLRMRPYYETVDYHFDIENPQVQIAEIAERLDAVLSEDDFAGQTEEEVQADLVAYLEYRLYDPEPIGDVMDQMLWLQVANGTTREQYHYDFLVRFLIEEYSNDNEGTIDMISDYILEKETLELTEWTERGKDLLAEYL
ncbi:LCP family protein [Patescibacteria group bacterium]|nr:LCP family protein [Patescibacteria group bacterium]MBU1907032.1 LCP family protein [Patescibacteria group bacterium]